MQQLSVSFRPIIGHTNNQFGFPIAVIHLKPILLFNVKQSHPWSLEIQSCLRIIGLKQGGSNAQS